MLPDFQNDSLVPLEGQMFEFRMLSHPRHSFAHKITFAQVSRMGGYFHHYFQFQESENYYRFGSVLTRQYLWALLGIQVC